MNDKASPLAVRVSELAEAMVEGVLRALAARKEFILPPGSTLGGCAPIPGDGGTYGTLRIAVTIGDGGKAAAKSVAAA
jgi:hypothetical protein